MYFNAIARNSVLIISVHLFSGCTPIDTKPFEQFNSSLTELNKGATSSLDVSIPLAEGRYRSEVETELKQGETMLLQELFILAGDKDPFAISKPPTFIRAKSFKLGISKANLAWLEYSSLLLQLSSKDLVSEEKFSKLSDDLNGNAFDAVQSFNNEAGNRSAENTALFSELAIATTKEYLRTKQKNKLLEAITQNQASINFYVGHMQSAIVTMAQLSTQEHSTKQHSLATDLVSSVKSNKIGQNDPQIHKIIGEMIDLKTTHSDQMESLYGLHAAYGKIPDAHEALATRLADPNSSLAAINDLLEAGIQLYSSYESKAKINKAELIQAKADAANSEATAAEISYQQAKLKYTQAQFEYILARNASDADPNNDNNKNIAEEKKKTAEELKIQSDALRESSESLRAAATAVQESAGEVKNHYK
ncbi:hypothetical protein [Pseudomonas donghuensis]|uniref:hypothetical protein n=1 Tax=Pseudomonas donghuensis TaxID=1163398 RepID=UPI00215E7E7B|nr:hypothetical protein [Pseudomonas donghuensis]UVL22764.1 hypothetical protein LOY30_18170 [Pseudomonas donghuensis]